MKGYCKEGILILPKKETIDARSHTFRLQLIRSARNLIKFFNSIDVQLYCFTTNEGYQELCHEIDGVKLYDITPMEDSFFIKKYCSITQNEMEGERPEDFDMYAEEVRKKFPTKGITDKYDKFNLIAKREKYIANRVLANTKLVINMEMGNNGCYKCVPKKDSKNIILDVKLPNFTVSATISDMPIATSYVFGKNNIVHFLYNWEVKEYGR